MKNLTSFRFLSHTLTRVDGTADISELCAFFTHSSMLKGSFYTHRVKTLSAAS